MVNINSSRKIILVTFFFLLQNFIIICITADQTKFQSYTNTFANKKIYRRRRRLKTTIPILPPVDKDGNRIRKKYSYIAKDDSLEVVAEYSDDAEIYIKPAIKEEDKIVKKNDDKNSKNEDTIEIEKGTEKDVKKTVVKEEDKIVKNEDNKNSKNKDTAEIKKGVEKDVVKSVAKEEDKTVMKGDNKNAKNEDTIKIEKSAEKVVEKGIKRSSKAPKGKRSSEKIKWRINVGPKGFVVNTHYENQINNDTKIDSSITASLLRLVEFVKDDPGNETELFEGQQHIVLERDLKKWQQSRFDGGCTDDLSSEEVCTAVFGTEDGCLTINTTLNLAQSISTERLSVDIDDAKLDFIFGDDCGVSDDSHALALIGSVRTDHEAKVKKSRKAVNNELDTLESDLDEGVSMFLSWLGEVDCYEKNTKIDDVSSRDMMFDDISSMGLISNASVMDMTQNSDVSVFSGDTVSVARKVGVFLPDKVDNEGKTNKKESIIYWTINQKKTDKGCVWDPILGASVVEDVVSGTELEIEEDNEEGVVNEKEKAKEKEEEDGKEGNAFDEEATGVMSKSASVSTSILMFLVVRAMSSTTYFLE